MTKAAALQAFWEGFGLPAYEENVLPEKARLPYLTYEAVSDGYGEGCPLSASLWYEGTGVKEINAKAEQIGSALGCGGVLLDCDSGKIWLRRGTPFCTARREQDVQERVLSLYGTFLTAE